MVRRDQHRAAPQVRRHSSTPLASSTVSCNWSVSSSSCTYEYARVGDVVELADLRERSRTGPAREREPGFGPVDSESRRTSPDLLILVDEAAAPAASDLVELGWSAVGEWARRSGLPQGAVRAMTVVVAL